MRQARKKIAMAQRARWKKIREGKKWIAKSSSEFCTHFCTYPQTRQSETDFRNAVKAVSSNG